MRKSNVLAFLIVIATITLPLLLFPRMIYCSYKSPFIMPIASGNIIVGLFTRQSTESSLVAGFSTVLLTTTFIDFASIISYFFTTYPAGTDGNFAAYIIFALFSVLWAGYLISVIQWWRGNDI